MTILEMYVACGATIALAIVGIIGWARLYNVTTPDAKK